MTFSFHRLRFHFRSRGPLYFPAYKSGNVLRGAFGSIFRKLACLPDCQDAKGCRVRETCPYARVFEPQSARGEGPSGLGDWPRPFVFRAAHLDGHTVRDGESFYFDLHLFDLHDPALEYFVLAFAQLAREGLGPGRVKADLLAVDSLDLAGERMEARSLCTVELAGGGERVERVRVRFVTPTELKGGQELVERPEFEVLFGRLRDRVSTLRALYGEGPLEIDFKGMGQRAAAVRLVGWDGRLVEVERYSTRSGQRHGLGGFVGEAEYVGDLGEFLEYLEVGRWVGVGRQTVWGKGELLVVR